MDYGTAAEDPFNRNNDDVFTFIGNYTAQGFECIFAVDVLLIYLNNLA